MRRGINSTPKKSEAYRGRVERGSTLYHIIEVLTEEQEPELPANELFSRVREKTGELIPRVTFERALSRGCKAAKYVCHGSEKGMYGLISRQQPSVEGWEEEDY